MKRRRGMHWALVAALFIGTIALVSPTPAPDVTDPVAYNALNIAPVTAAAREGLAETKFGDKCSNTSECAFNGSICDTATKTCQCIPELPATNHVDKCGKKAAVNESCLFSEQCEMTLPTTACQDGHCVCRFEQLPEYKKDGSIECVAPPPPAIPKYLDPAMIGVLVGMALMFVIICVVLRLFSKARWRENRTIFNTPNPRLMNVSLLRDSKLLHGNEQRRGSRASVRAPSRQPSMASLRPHSPSGSPGSRRGSKGSLHSPTSAKSQTNPHPNHHDHHATHHEAHHEAHHVAHHEPPIVESVTVEVQEPKV